jgi:hypothetical protein
MLSCFDGQHGLPAILAELLFGQTGGPAEGNHVERAGAGSLDVRGEEA